MGKAVKMGRAVLEKGGVAAVSSWNYNEAHQARDWNAAAFRCKWSFENGASTEKSSWLFPQDLQKCVKKSRKV